MEAVIDNPLTMASSVEFEPLLAEYQSMVYSIALHFLRDRASAEELAQDVFLALHRNLGSIQSNDHARHWLRRITCQRAIDRTRRAKIRGEVSLEAVGPVAIDTRQPDVFAEARLQRLVAALPEKLRMVVILRYQEDLGPTEIAETLDMPVRAVKGYLHRALEMLREKEGRWTN